MMNIKNQRGITLLEILLVLGIIGAIIYFSIQQYTAYRESADVRQVAANVDIIFTAMTSYYKNNCYGQKTDTSTPAWGTLNPNNTTTNPLSSPSFPIDITNDLRDNGYLTLNIPVGSIVDYTASNQGYVAQFNLTTMPRLVCTQSSPSGGAYGLTPAENCLATAKVGTIISWQAQIAVKLKNPKFANTYLHALGGDCLSSLSGNVVEPCSSNSPGPYVVWARSPSLANMYNTTPSWPTNHVIMQFTNAYRTYNVEYLITEAGSNTPGGNGEQYYVCGD